jgi:hypothetical protein
VRAKVERIDPENLALLSLARHDHINPHGQSQFRIELGQPEGQRIWPFGHGATGADDAGHAR